MEGREKTTKQNSWDERNVCFASLSDNKGERKREMRKKDRKILCEKISSKKEAKER